MGKILLKAGTMIYPLPAVLVSCGENEEEYNLVTVAWTGTLCTSPPMCYISLRPERYSFDIISRTRAFVINLTTPDMVDETDFCGIKSGRDIDKFSVTGLTPVPASVVNAPLILQSPLNIECAVTDIIPLGSHHMFMAEVKAIHGNEELYDKSISQYKLTGNGLLCYAHGNYYTLGKQIGKFGFSADKKPKQKKISQKKR